MTITLRAATPDDAHDMAVLFDIAGQGLPATLWAAMAEPGQTPIEVGTARAARDEGSFSWRNAIMAEYGGQTAGIINSYEIGATPTEIDSDTPAMFHPLIQLENAAPLTRYINVIATFERFRRKGVARALMAHAETMPGPNGMSLIATDGNTNARAFYKTLGYQEGQQLPIIKGGWKTDNTTWILITKAP